MILVLDLARFLLSLSHFCQKIAKNITILILMERIIYGVTDDAIRLARLLSRNLKP